MVIACETPGKANKQVPLMISHKAIHICKWAADTHHLFHMLLSGEAQCASFYLFINVYARADNDFGVSLMTCVSHCLTTLL